MNAHPLVRALFILRNEDRRAIASDCDKAGISRATAVTWTKGRVPGVGNLDAMLNVSGYQLVIRPIGEPIVCIDGNDD